MRAETPQSSVAGDVGFEILRNARRIHSLLVLLCAILTVLIVSPSAVDRYTSALGELKLIRKGLEQQVSDERIHRFEDTMLKDLRRQCEQALETLALGVKERQLARRLLARLRIGKLEVVKMNAVDNPLFAPLSKLRPLYFQKDVQSYVVMPEPHSFVRFLGLPLQPEGYESVSRMIGATLNSENIHSVMLWYRPISSGPDDLRQAITAQVSFTLRDLPASEPPDVGAYFESRCDGRLVLMDTEPGYEFWRSQGVEQIRRFVGEEFLDEVWDEVSDKNYLSASSYFRAKLNASERIVSALGLPIPEILLSWLTPLLLTLWTAWMRVHLGEICLNAARFDPTASDFPWVVLYRSRAASAVSLSTLVLLPTFACAMTVLQTWHPVPCSWLGLALSITTLLISIDLWRLRKVLRSSLRIV